MTRKSLYLVASKETWTRLYRPNYSCIIIIETNFEDQGDHAPSSSIDLQSLTDLVPALIKSFKSVLDLLEGKKKKRSLEFSCCREDKG